MFGDWKLTDRFVKSAIGSDFDRNRFRLRIVQPTSISIVDENGKLVADMDLPFFEDTLTVDIDVISEIGIGRGEDEIKLEWLPRIKKGGLSWIKK